MKIDERIKKEFELLTPDIKEHSLRTSEYAYVLFEVALKQKIFPIDGSFCEDLLSQIKECVKYHDVGIRLVDISLSMPTHELTLEEIRARRMHVSLVSDLFCGDYDKLGQMVMDCCECHHEWYNGQGYPNGFAKEDIPLIARFCKVANDFDCMTIKNGEAYFPDEYVLSHFKKNISIRYDPQIAAVFLDIYDKMTKMRDGFLKK